MLGNFWYWCCILLSLYPWLPSNTFLVHAYMVFFLARNTASEQFFSLLDMGTCDISRYSLVHSAKKLLISSESVEDFIFSMDRQKLIDFCWERGKILTINIFIFVWQCNVEKNLLDVNNNIDQLSINTLTLKIFCYRFWRNDDDAKRSNASNGDAEIDDRQPWPL